MGQTNAIRLVADWEAQNDWTLFSTDETVGATHTRDQTAALSLQGDWWGRVAAVNANDGSRRGYDFLPDIALSATFGLRVKKFIGVAQAAPGGAGTEVAVVMIEDLATSRIADLRLWRKTGDGNVYLTGRLNNSGGSPVYVDPGILIGAYADLSVGTSANPLTVGFQVWTPVLGSVERFLRLVEEPGGISVQHALAYQPNGMIQTQRLLFLGASGLGVSAEVDYAVDQVVAETGL